MTERTDPASRDDGDDDVVAAPVSIDASNLDLFSSQTAQVTIVLPASTDDDELDDDGSGELVDDGDEIDVTIAAEVIDDGAADDDERDGDEIDDQESPVDDEETPVPDETTDDAVIDSTPEVIDVPVPAPVAATDSAAPVAAAVAAVAVSEPRRTTDPVQLVARRAGEVAGDRGTSDLLSADRLLENVKVARPEPEGLWPSLVFALSGRRINLGDNRRARARKELDQKIAAPLSGRARFVAVLSRKGGVGKTTVTTLLGMALASARDDRVIAVDANPDRGTLAERIGRPSGKTVRDLARAGAVVSGFNEISSIVARDETRLDVLASDADPRVSDAFNDADYRDVATLAAHYYSVVLTDTGTGIVHEVMGATLDLADGLVIVAGLSVDEARLASETLTWLETNGYADLVRRAVVVINASRPGASAVREAELEAHFRSRVRDVVRVPYDPAIAVGGPISFRELLPATRQAARLLAASVVEGLRSVSKVA
ncbi:CobQ/CobB/MinD/ParA nucleotide binding domain protein [Microbacterium ginsengisoli]|jgi:MinD-like ATPase involved in chromosome partitioning or flagellar assembly|uniref:CobQ/CobB/MinD/ParA nucleotide binding domain protein n=1 Tax=Microbacterium ginsengisoli TaxID=400772 RepID=A0A0F0LUZ7_9MICO|nr:MinD/ParA family protein [Microbacterium ginsengisoli]KJL36928.1 CobQ/CobB/MinD/ParA nucleotide binding domain protein [Microbacterium ginsengisoli]